MAISDTVLIALAGVAGGILAKAWDYYRPKKKEIVDTSKVTIETRILTDVEQRAKDQFCQDRLEKLERKFSVVDSLNEKLKEKIRELTEMFEQSEKEKNELKIELTYARIDLAAYKPN